MLSELTNEQHKAVRLITVVRRRTPTDAEMEQVRIKGSNYRMFRLNFLLGCLHPEERDTLIERFRRFIRSDQEDAWSPAKLEHELEVSRLRIVELQNRIDALQSTVLELLRHGEKVNAALGQHGKLQGEISELRHLLCHYGTMRANPTGEEG